MDYYCSECELKVVVYRDGDEVKIIKACPCEAPIVASITMKATGGTKVGLNV